MSRRGEYHFCYQHNDRGRGDSVYGVVKTAENSLINSVIITSADYYKNSSNETFSVLTHDQNVQVSDTTGAQ